MTPAKLPPEVKAYFSRMGKKSAKQLTAAERKAKASAAGKGNLTKLTAKARRERARNAVNARWSQNGKRK
jgi:hypothetical protein